MQVAIDHFLLPYTSIIDAPPFALADVKAEIRRRLAERSALAAELERLREGLKELRYEVERSPAPDREAMWNIIHAALGPAGEAKCSGCGGEIPREVLGPFCSEACQYPGGGPLGCEGGRDPS